MGRIFKKQGPFATVLPRSHRLGMKHGCQKAGHMGIGIDHRSPPDSWALFPLPAQSQLHTRHRAGRAPGSGSITACMRLVRGQSVRTSLRSGMSPRRFQIRKGECEEAAPRGKTTRGRTGEAGSGPDSCRCRASGKVADEPAASGLQSRPESTDCQVAVG